ncbi:MAG: cell division protein FtsZ [Oscillospiraceae bacterium]|nr:cell division protein FtsZ [Oscillospiraceae bacterium]
MAIMVDSERNTYDEVIKVVGVGGGGGNAVNRMVEEGIKGVDYITVNTDARALNSSKADTKVQIGIKLTNGKGAGAKPEVGASSAEENRDEIKAALSGSDMVFIAAGMGGGTGTGAAPIVAEIAQELGILTVAVVTKPFEFERPAKMRTAEAGIAELKKHVDSLIVIPNERLLQSSEKELTMKESFALADNILKVGVKSIAELITVEGDINLDFADIKTTMKDAGYAHMAIGHGSGKDKAAEAAKQVTSSPLLETSISGATRLLVNIVMSEDVFASDINTATKLISDAADPEVNMIFGTSFDPDMKDEMNITVIAAAFNDDPSRIVYEEDEPEMRAPEVEVIPAQTVKTETKKNVIDEDYSAFFDMINRH